jgi:predicted CDP-diglyceride synthetase/phosphatidate cytidylyltransferase
MAFPTVLTEDEAKFLRTMSILQFARFLGVFVFTVVWLAEQFDLPLTEIDGEDYVNLDEFEAWAAGQDFQSIWENADNKYKICFKRSDVGGTDPLELGKYGADCPAVLANGQWWR